MKHLSALLVLLALLFTSVASASGFIESSQSYWTTGEFNIVYDEKNDVYWAMMPSKAYIGDFVLPFFVRYDVFRISGDFSQTEKAFSDGHMKLNMMASENGLLYERELSLSGTAEYIYEYNPNTGKNKKAVPYPVEGLMGKANGKTLYVYDNPNDDRVLDLYSYDISAKQETLLARDVVPCVMNAQSLFYRGNNGQAYEYSLETMQNKAIDMPENISDVNNNGYMLNDDDCLLYTPNGNIIHVDFIAGAKSIDLQDNWLYAFHREEARQFIQYIHLNQADDVITVELPKDENLCLMICNDKAFLSDSREHEISYVDLLTGEKGNILLPHFFVSRLIAYHSWVFLAIPVLVILAICKIRKFVSRHRKRGIVS